MPATVGLGCVLAFFLTAGTAIPLGRKKLGNAIIYGLSLATCLVALVNGLVHLGGGTTETLTLPFGLPLVGMQIRIDPLASFFLVVINLGGAAASFYALGYGRHEPAPLRVLPPYAAYLGAMNLVPYANDAFTFLFAWELMSLTSWALVLANDRAGENARAGLTYLLMASFGTLTLLLAFALLAGSEGGFTFDAIRQSHPGPYMGGTVLLLVLIGAGSKAGLVPLHVWLPLAHPAAPSHVSALMSGVMTKVAVYGFVRIIFDLLAETAWWHGLIVLGVGSGTAVVGVLYALMQRDLKRLLAYSTVENIGVIFAGLGLALAFRANGTAWTAALALTAAFLHVLNHSIIKSLLFFGAGAISTATRERNMDHLGGLIHRLPQTALLFFIGCAAISALPPLNAFVSEWLIFQTILEGPLLPQWGLKLMVPAAGALLALAAALTAACFVKAFGIAFLGRSRTPAAANAKEVDRFSVAAMVLLAALCLLLGVFPGVAIDALSPVVQAMVGEEMPKQSSAGWLSIVPIAESRSSYNGMIILIFLISVAIITAAVVHQIAGRVTRRSAMWDCGYPDASPVTQYTASSFAMPIRRVFAASLFHVHESIDIPRPGEVRAGRYRLRISDPAWRFIFGPVLRWTRLTANRLNALQYLTIRLYLTLTFGALIFLLLAVAAWR
jgi:formate hydrogenlyase subunit 3/multisubunit Na+/H+ antiporter MnhD subunit